MTAQWGDPKQPTAVDGSRAGDARAAEHNMRPTKQPCNRGPSCMFLAKGYCMFRHTVREVEAAKKAKAERDARAKN